MDEVGSFDINLLFARDVKEHKYDDCDLSWLFAPAKIEVDAGSWIEITDSIDIDAMFAVNVEEYEYDDCDLTWLFNPIVEIAEEDVEDYADCDLSWLFPPEVGLSDYEDCGLSWLFPDETTKTWMDNADDFDIAAMFESAELIVIEFKSIEPATEVLVESRPLEDIITDSSSFFLLPSDSDTEGYSSDE